MALDRVEVVRGVWEEWSRGDMNAGVELFDPEIEFRSFMPDASEQVEARGPAAIGEFMREFLRHWREYRLIAEEIEPIGADTVFVTGRQEAAGRHSGATVADSLFSAWVFEGDRVVRLSFDRDRKAALAAVDREY